MARRAKAPYEIKDRDGWAYLECRIGGTRPRPALGLPYCPERPRTPERRALEEAAASKFASLVRDRVTEPGPEARVVTPSTLEEVLGLWLDAIETPRNRDSVATKRTYARHFIAFACDSAKLPDGSPRWKGDGRTPLERIASDEGPLDYAMHRLSHVQRKTWRKENCALFEWFAWMRHHKMTTSVPQRALPPRSMKGVRSGPQREHPVEITNEEARAIVAALPEWSSTKETKSGTLRYSRFRVRDVFLLMWEMTWRPSFIARLSVPKNWAHGDTHVTIYKEQDKAEYGRRAKLTARAREILERCAPKSGLVFGKHDYRAFIKAAALKVLPRHKALEFARYDFRHGRISHLLDLTGDLRGTAEIAGHRQLTTTNAYAKANRRRGESVIDRADAEESGHTTVTRGKSQPRPISPMQRVIYENLVGAAGFEPTTPRPPAQRGKKAPGGRNGGGEDARGKTRVKPVSSGAIGSRFGHTPEPLIRSAGALAIQTVTWDAFDAFALAAEGDEA